MGSSSFGSKVTSSTRRHSFSKMTLWCLGAAATASNAGSQVDGSKSARLSAMLPSSVQFNGLNSIAQPDLGDVRFTPKADMDQRGCDVRSVPQKIMSALHPKAELCSAV